MNTRKERIEEILRVRANLASGSRGTRHDSFARTRMEEKRGTILNCQRKRKKRKKE